MFRALYAAMGDAAPFARAADYLAMCMRRPDIPAINEMRIDPARLAADQQAEVSDVSKVMRAA